MTCPTCTCDATTVVKPYRANRSRLFEHRSLVECRRCSFVFAQPMPSSEDLSSYYQSYWSRREYRSTAVKEAYFLAQSYARLDFLAMEPGRLGSVLDVGAGSGKMLQALLSRGFKGVYDAVEPDKGQAAVLALWKRGRVFRTFEEIGAKQARQYDLIVLSHVLEHVSAPHAFLKGIVQLLVPGGTLFIEVPQRDDLYKAVDEPHLLFFSQASLRVLLADHGTVVRIVGCGQCGESLRECITQDESYQRSLKRLIPYTLLQWARTILGKDRPPDLSELTHSYQLNVYTDRNDCQWIRATLVRN